MGTIAKSIFLNHSTCHAAISRLPCQYHATGSFSLSAPLSRKVPTGAHTNTRTHHPSSSRKNKHVRYTPHTLNTHSDDRVIELGGILLSPTSHLRVRARLAKGQLTDLVQRWRDLQIDILLEPVLFVVRASPGSCESARVMARM